MYQATKTRFVVLLLVALVVAAIWFSYAAPGTVPQYGALVRSYALLAFALLYITLLISPLGTLFPKLPYKPVLVHARRALGVSALIVGCLHGLTAFTKQLGGLEGLSYLGMRYLVAVSAGFLALLILLLLGLTSFDVMVRKLGRHWKQLHRFVYVAGFLILFHALSIGSLFTDLRTPGARAVLLLVFGLITLEAIRMDRLLNKKSDIGMFTMVTVAIACFSLGAFATSGTTGVSLHSTHIGRGAPLIQGDSSKKFMLEVVKPEVIESEQEVAIEFKISDASTGLPVNRFTKFYEKFIHLIIVDSSLTHFEHLHPDTTAEGTFKLTTRFPSPGRYHLYLNVVPFQATEQVLAATIQVGSGVTLPDETLFQETVALKEVNGYEVRLTDRDLKSQLLSASQQALSFRVEKDGEPVTTLYPYIGAFGHLSMINMQTFEFIHAHPRTVITSPEERSGPTIDFYPMSALVKPGTYRVFTELAPDGVYTVVLYTVIIQ